MKIMTAKHDGPPERDESVQAPRCRRCFFISHEDITTHSVANGEDSYWTQSQRLLISVHAIGALRLGSVWSVGNKSGAHQFA